MRLNFPVHPKVDKLRLETRNFNYEHVCNYLIESVSDIYVDVSVTKESDDEDECSESQGTEAWKPLKKGVYLLKRGFVHDSQDNMDTNAQYYIVRAHVHHSMTEVAKHKYQ